VVSFPLAQNVNAVPEQVATKVLLLQSSPIAQWAAKQPCPNRLSVASGLAPTEAGHPDPAITRSGTGIDIARWTHGDADVV
jgi:hypothetical protein